jgi:hypothetical protein
VSRATERSRKGAVLASLSGEPEATWGGRLTHHGSRVLLLVGLAVLVTALFPPTGRMDVAQYEVGSVALEDVIARVGFEVPKSPEELARDRRLAMQSVTPTFDYVPEAADSMAVRLERLFERIDTAAASGDRSAVQQVLRDASLVATPSQIDELMDPETREVLEEAALTATRRILREGVVDAGQVMDLTTQSVTVRAGPGDQERAVPVDEIFTSRQFFDAALGLLPPSAAPDVADLLRIILIRTIDYTYQLNVVATELDRDAAARSVPTVKAEILEDQAIVREADPIGQEDVERLAAYEEQLRAQGLLESRGFQPVPVLGSILLNVLILGIFGLLLFFFRQEVYGNYRWLLLIAILAAAYVGAGAAIARNELPVELLPIAFVALPVGVLWDARMSLVLVLVLAALTGSLAPFADYGTVVAVMAGGAAAALSVRAVRRRSETWVSIAIIAAATGVALLAHSLATSADLEGVARGFMWAAANATISALLAMGFLWVFELFTGITTDQTLLEWADPTRPLLKRLSMEAPGTYAHTINVANLAEAAANVIGANGLLCRVGVYYHDVGKMLKPHYFVENQPEGRNPHDKLKPETSATIVREHVTEGARLARDAGVPETVVDFILEHHGTQKIGFFFEKAREEAGEEDAARLDEARFAYPGPKPQSRETAIVMLADSCESATRAMQDPTPERIRDLIDTVVQGKVGTGQLDEAPMTLHEIARVKDQFVNILSGVVHRRIEYPATKHLTDADPDAAEPEEETEGGESPAAETAGAQGSGDAQEPLGADAGREERSAGAGAKGA